jgi:hypothetical protein
MSLPRLMNAKIVNQDGRLETILDGRFARTGGSRLDA